MIAKNEPPAKPRKPRKTASRKASPRTKSPYTKLSGSRGTNSGGRIPQFLQRRALWLVIVRLAMAGFIILGIATMIAASRLPDIHALETIKKQQGVTIETEDGRVVANYGDVYGSYLPYDKLPKQLVQAVIATEDRRFFEHHGIDVWGILRAVVTNVLHGHLVQGGSTVTQQVAKNVFLTPERSMSRKLQELLLALWLEGRFSKKEIMAIYLNRVYLGSGTFGVDAAAHRYFGKSAVDLNLYESALMAGLLKAPSRYSPAASVERARDRVHQVLINMEDAGYIREKDIETTMASYAKSPSHASEGGDVRYFTDWVMDQLPNYVGQSDQDLVVTTTMSSKLQNQAADALQTIVGTEGPSKRVSQGAIVAMTPDGAVKAMVGGLSYAKSQYNRAAQAKRQPGSVFKLFVYLSALEAGMTPLSTVEDAPISLQVGNKLWSPENSHRSFKGEVPMVQALRESLNTVSVRLSQYAGIERVASMAMRLGIPDVPPHPSIALGAVEATLVELTGAYAHLPNHGNKVEPYGIVRIRTNKGDELYKREEKPTEQVLSNGTVEMMNYMLLDVVNRGTGFKAKLKDRVAGGKTGTSQDFKDAWFIGFTPQLVAGVWVGNDDNKPMAKVMGGTIPSEVWHEFMTHAMEGEKALPIPNSASSTDGLLPWLFGGANNNAAGDQPTTAPTVIPQDSPFGLAHPEPAAEQTPAPVIEEQPVPSNTPLAQPQAPAASFTPPAPVMAALAAPTQVKPATPFDMLVHKPIEQAPAKN